MGQHPKDITHVYFPEISAKEIGWEVSLFQFEVGIADLTVGVLGVLAFWGAKVLISGSE